MARFDVYRNPGKTEASTPYLLDVQSPLLQGLATRVVVPLRRLDQFSGVQPPAKLMPKFSIDGVDCVMETPKLAAVPNRILQTPLTSLAEHQHDIIAALDFLFQGY